MSDHIDLLKHLSLTHRDHYRSRRATEWQCFFTTLGFYVLSIAAIYNGKDKVTLSIAAAVTLEIFVAVLGVSTISFLVTLNMASNRDKELAERAEDAMRSTIDPSTALPNSLLGFEKYCSSWRHIGTCRRGLWGSAWQAVAVALFAATTIILIHVRP